MLQFFQAEIASTTSLEMKKTHGKHGRFGVIERLIGQFTHKKNEQTHVIICDRFLNGKHKRMFMRELSMSLSLAGEIDAIKLKLDGKKIVTQFLLVSQ